LRTPPGTSTVANVKPRTRKALWILIGILLIASLFLAGPAHNVLHHGPQDIGGCDVCYFATPEPAPFEPLVFWLAMQPLERALVVDLVADHVLPEQGNARAPPAAG
jgi:hypothetical protein